MGAYELLGPTPGIGIGIGIGFGIGIGIGIGFGIGIGTGLGLGLGLAVVACPLSRNGRAPRGEGRAVATFAEIKLIGGSGRARYPRLSS